VVARCCCGDLFLVTAKDGLLKIEGLLDEFLSFVKDNDLLIAFFYDASVQVEVFILLNCIEMPASFHEVNIDINSGRLSSLALRAIKNARVFVAAQIIHQFIFPFQVKFKIFFLRLIFFLFLWLRGLDFLNF